jgi:hypothetical protein
VDDSVSSEQPGAALQGALRWLCVQDDLLRGLTHSLSNRVGTISAAAYILEIQPTAGAASAATLRVESERLEALLQLMRLLPRRPDASAEPVVPTDVLQQAIDVLAHHPERYEQPIRVTVDGDLQPAYVEPAAYAMALAVLFAAAQRNAGPLGEVSATVQCTVDVVSIAAVFARDDGAEHRDDALTAADLAAVEWLLAAAGGRARRDAGALHVTVPTLQATRRAQRR